MYKGLYIPPIGKFKEITVDFSKNKISDILNTELTYHDSLGYMDQFGYKLCMYCGDLNSDDNLDRPNLIATVLSKKTQIKGDLIYGPVVLLDDDKDITIDEFKKIYAIAKSFNYIKY